MSISIVIPTFNHADRLKACVESVLAHSQGDGEIIPVCNGCTDETASYLAGLNGQVHKLWFDQPIGYTRAANEGIKYALGKNGTRVTRPSDYVVLLNNDTVVLGSQWLSMLLDPFRNPRVGATGPMKVYCPYAQTDFLIFFCVAVRREIFEECGLLDEIFSPGYGEDSDFCARIKAAGYEIAQVPHDTDTYYAEKRMVGGFPIFHEGNVTFKNWPDGDKLLQRNRGILTERWAGKFKVQSPKSNGQKAPDQISIVRAQRADGFMSDAELTWLAEQSSKFKAAHVLTNVATFIEVGSWHGKSTLALADNMPEKAVLYCVDTWLGSLVERDTHHASARLEGGDHAYLEFSRNLADHLEARRVVPMRMNSLNAARLLAERGVRADLIFLDAGHTQAEIEADIQAWLPILKEGGLLCGHDYTHTDVWPDVKRAVDALVPGAEVAPGTSIWAMKVQSSKFKGPLVWDTFPFNNELDVLEMRLTELENVVDRFVICEATLTHGGQSKPLYFAENRERFARWLPKIVHVAVDDYPALDSWSIERHQRDCIMRGMNGADDSDVVIHGDCDEIPSAAAVAAYLEESKVQRVQSPGIRCFEQSLRYYRLDLEDATQKWQWLKILPFKKFREIRPCDTRYYKWGGDEHLIRNGGWHLSYLGDTRRIIKKIEDSAHQEYNKPEWTDPAKVEALVEGGQDLYGRPFSYAAVPITNETMPQAVLKQRGRWQKLGYFKNPPLKHGAVTATISTRNRYHTTLPLVLQAVALQTRRPDRLILYDDGEHKDLRQVAPYPHLFSMFDRLGISWEVIFGQRRGQVANHQHALENANTEFIWRLDDDAVPEANVLEGLLEAIQSSKGPVGAVAGLVRQPEGFGPRPEFLTAGMADLDAGLNLQWFAESAASETPKLRSVEGSVSGFGVHALACLEAEHLYSTFLYRVEAGQVAGGYPQSLSPAGHREETWFTHAIKRAGYRLLITPKAVTWHHRDPQGGIRDNKPEAWHEDERKFREQCGRWGIQFNAYKFCVLDAGLGDHLAFKSVLNKIIESHAGARLILAVCYPEVFEGDGLNLISIADAKAALGDITEFNIYKKMIDWQWTRPLAEAYVKLYE